MRLTVGDVLRQLVDERLADPDALDRARRRLAAAAIGPPWIARIIAGVGAWVATGCLVGFLVMADIVNEGNSAIVVGGVLLAIAVYVRRSAGVVDGFARQLSFSVSLAGQVLVLVGVMQTTRSAAATGLVAVALSAALVVVMPDPTHRFTSGLIGSVGLIATVADAQATWHVFDWPSAIIVRGTDLAALVVAAFAAYVWRGPPDQRGVDTSERLAPVGYGATVALFAVLLFGTLFAVAGDVAHGSRSPRVNAWTLGPLTTVGLTAGLVALEVAIVGRRVNRRHGEVLVVAIAGTVLLGVATLFTPGIIAAAGLLALGYDRRNAVLVGLAVAFLVKFASAYYYSLDLTLLAKSIVLAASGGLLLLGRAFIALRYGGEGGRE